MLAFSRICLGQGKTVTCHRCAGGTPAPVQYRAAADVTDDVVRVSAVSPASGIHLTGPEPFDHPALPAIIGAVTGAGVVRVGIETSAAALVYGENAPGSIAAGVRLIEVPLLGPDAAAHDALAGSAGAFDAAGAGVARFRAASDAAGARGVVRGRIDVCPHTFSSLPATVVTYASWGVSSIELRCAGPQDRRVLEQVRAACETGTINGVWVAVTGVAPALLGSDSLHATDVLEFTGVDG